MPVETTLYSISSDPPPAESRRSSERHLTIFRVGSIFIEGTRELCLVKNISAGGALIRAYCSLEVGQELMIEIKEGNPVPGRVSWLRGSDSGIEFESPIDVVDLLTAGSEGRRPRMPRIETHCIGFVREGAVVHRAYPQYLAGRHRRRDPQRTDGRRGCDCEPDRPCAASGRGPVGRVGPLRNSFQ
jgi:hypothetical protein